MKQAILIRQKQIGNKGMFFVGGEENILAEMTYNMPSNNKMIIEHTEVNDELRGQNVGFQLVKAAVDYARLNNVKIIPLCPFANSVFRKKKDFQDVLFI